MSVNLSQLIVCLTRKSKAKILIIEKNKNEFYKLINQFDAYIGSMGASNNIFEGSLMTPKGLFSITQGFYKGIKPKSGIPLFKIEKDTIWVDDPQSPLYNKKALLPIKCRSYEEMYKIKEYEYGFVINYNTNPIIKNKGSAIFFHIGEKPTKGCIAAKKEDLLYLIGLLDITKSPHILII